MEEGRGGLSVSQFLRGVLIAAVLVTAGWILYTIRGSLMPFGIAFVLSYLLVPVVDYLESHRINRMAGTALVLVSIIGIFVVSIVTFVPVLVTGMGDMKDSILGNRPTWSCVVANRGWDVVRFDEGKTSHPDFVLDPDSLPIELSPGEQDTISIGYVPTSMAPIVATAVISVDGEDTELVLRLSGNLSEVADPMNFVPGKVKSLGEIQLALSDSAYSFGRVEPGYLMHFKMQIAALQPQVQKAFPTFENFDIAEQIGDFLQDAATEVLNETPALLSSVLSGMTFLVIVPLVLFFLLAEGRSIKRSLIEIIPNQYFEMVLNLLHRIDQQLGGYIRGMVMSVVLISMLSMLGLRIIGLRDYLVVGTIAGVSNIIPYLGPLIGIFAGTIAAILQYSTLGWATILPVVIVFLAVQLMDNVFVQPVVVARAVNLHPLIVIFVVLVGSQMFGAVGMLLAVPLTAVIKVSVQTVYESLRSYSLT
jgi:predicted PurR-regulated permease PerM